MNLVVSEFIQSYNINIYHSITEIALVPLLLNMNKFHKITRVLKQYTSENSN